LEGDIRNKELEAGIIQMPILLVLWERGLKESKQQAATAPTTGVSVEQEWKQNSFIH
jgi:hypothetical protein